MAHCVKNVQIIEMSSRCRLCAEYCNDFLPILDDIALARKIEHLFQVKVIAVDQHQHVCLQCHEIVQNTWEFSEKVHKAQEILLEAELNIECDTNLTQIAENEFADCEIPVELQETQDDDDLGEVPDIPDTETELQAEEIVLEKRVSTRNKSKNKTKSKKDDESELSGISDSEVNEDGSVNLLKKIEGWQEYPWACCDCRLQVAGPEDLREHYLSNHGNPPRYPCADCPKIYTKFSMFLTHARIHRPQLKFCCDFCGKWFLTSRQTERHKACHGDERPHGCTTCGKRFRMQSALLVHSRSHLPADVKNRHQCDQCPKKFGTKPNLMAHKRIHAGVRDYTCDQCGKSFVQKGNLDNHLLTHTVARPFPCTTCGKTFKTLVRLRKHGSVHSGLKPHQCDVCGRQFRERGTLKEHHRIHTGAMPFTCEFCGKSFRFKGVLTTHRRQHTGERPYSCFECQHHFTNWPNYNKHMKRRHGINTSVTVRKPQSIPPTGMPQRNPPGTILAAPDVYPEQHNNQTQFYPVLSLYNIPEELLQQRV